MLLRPSRREVRPYRDFLKRKGRTEIGGTKLVQTGENKVCHRLVES